MSGLAPVVEEEDASELKLGEGWWNFFFSLASCFMLGNKLRSVICVEKLSRGSSFFFVLREQNVIFADRKDRYLHSAAEFEK
jgi:hypothetical protein